MSDLFAEKTVEICDSPLNGWALNFTDRLGNLILSQKNNLRNFSVLVFINFLVAGLSFVTKVKIANTLGKAEFGLFAYGLAIAAYGGAIISFGFDRTLVRDLIHFPERQSLLVTSSLLLRGFLFLAVTVALLIWKYFSLAASDLAWGVVLVALGQSMVGLELRAIYDSWGKMSRHAIYSLIQRCLYFAAVWLMIILAPEAFSIFWIGVFLLITFSFYIWLQCFWAFKRIKFSGIKTTTFNDTLVLAKGNLIVWLSTMGALTIAVFNQIVLKALYGKESLGGYAAGWQIVSIAMIFLTQVARIGNPATARITKSGVSKIAKVKFLIKYSAVMFLVVSPVCIATIVWPEFILRLIYSPEYASAAGALRLMGVYMMVFSLGLVASQYVISLRKDKTYFASVILGGTLSIILCLVLIPKMKDLGAVLALLIAHTFSILIYFAAIVKNIYK